MWQRQGQGQTALEVAQIMVRSRVFVVVRQKSMEKCCLEENNEKKVLGEVLNPSCLFVRGRADR